MAIKAPVGRWWLDDGKDSGVWPCEVLGITPFGTRVRTTLEAGPYYGETIIVDRSRVYDSRFNHPTLEVT